MYNIIMMQVYNVLQTFIRFFFLSLGPNMRLPQELQIPSVETEQLHKKS